VHATIESGQSAQRVHPLQKWLDGLEEELFAQGDFEAGMGLPVTPFMDRSLPGISSRQASTSHHSTQSQTSCCAPLLPSLNERSPSASKACRNLLCDASRSHDYVCALGGSPTQSITMVPDPMRPHLELE